MLLDAIRKRFGDAVAILFGIGMAIVGPAVAFAVGRLAGEIIVNENGQRAVDGINLILDTTRFTAENLPDACSVLAVIGWFLRGRQFNQQTVQVHKDVRKEGD